MPDFLPTRDADLVTWSTNFSTKITATPTAYGLNALQAAAYATLHDTFVAAFGVASDPATRSPTNIILKDAARDALKSDARVLAGVVQKFPAITDAQRSELNLSIPTPHTPIGAPTLPPILEVRERLGTWIQIRLHDGTGTSRAMPNGVQGARVYSFIGPVPPVGTVGWTMEGQTTRAIVDLEFPATAVPGTVVWLTAQYYNPRGETGPACSPVQTVIAGGAMPEAA